MRNPDPPFLFESVLSLEPLIATWRAAAEGTSVRSAMAARLLERLAQAPELEQPITDLTVLDRHRDLLDGLMGTAFPSALWEQACVAAVPPFQGEPFYATPTFERLQILNPARGVGHLKNLDAESYLLGKTIKAYSLILEQFYGVSINFDYPLIFATTDPRTGLAQYFKLSYDPRFCTLQQRGPLPALSDEDVQRLMAEPMDLARWQELLPPERFAFQGFVLVSAVDVTDQEVLSALKDDLLQKDAMGSPEKVDLLQDRLRALVRCPDLQIGLICWEHGDVEARSEARALGRSLLIGREEGIPICPSAKESTYAKALASACDPVIVSDLETWQPRTAFEKRLLSLGLRNVVLAPLRFEGETVGLLEMASPRVGALHYLNALKMKDAVTLFATAMKRSLDEREDRVQALIKEKYTAIHPAVEWRFRKAALAYMNRAPEPIVFPDVYPLYGLTDIRDSSTHRAAAIQADLVEQLSLALGIIVEASTVRPLPILDELGHRIRSAADAIDAGLRSEDEVSVFDFLREDVEPLFHQLETFGPGVRRKVDAYRAALDPQPGILYHRRKDFEESVTLINDTVSAYLDEQEGHAQRMFPHYFEKYKTDGVDYNIYVGASLLERGTFDPLYLRNLRLWQLMTTCGIVWELERLQPRLKVPLSTAHLVLVQSAPLSIRFRQDEKRFDVDGAYNIRYEIVKKRIDKARIRGSRERLTQPQQIAIVYTHAKEAQEYLRYLDYLRAAGFVTGPAEELELEDLQGMHGLKALRVTVQSQPPEAEVYVEPERVQEAALEMMAPAEV